MKLAPHGRMDAESAATLRSLFYGTNRGEAEATRKERNFPTLTSPPPRRTPAVAFEFLTLVKLREVSKSPRLSGNSPAGPLFSVDTVAVVLR